MARLRKSVISLILGIILLPLAAAVDTGDINYDTFSAPYAADAHGGDVLYYPNIFDGNSVGNVARFEDGDRVAFIGDSITHFGYTHTLIYHYYTTRYPGSSFSYINKGMSGDKTPDIIERMEHDVYDSSDRPFNKAVIMIGTNDMACMEYYEGKELEPDAEEARAERIENYRNNLTNLVRAVKQRDMEQIILVSPPMFDQWLPEEIAGRPYSVDFNNIIRKAGAIAYEVSKDEGVDFIDINTPQTIAEYYNTKNKGESFTFVPDRIHPSSTGHYIMAYAFLKAQGESGEVATVNIDADKNSISSQTAAVSEFYADSSTVKYKYTANALPIGADEAYRKAEEIFPITQELNREIIRAHGLADGVYDIKIDGALIMRATADMLKKGVNIADKENNPGQRQALKVLGIGLRHSSDEQAYRYFIAEEISHIKKYALDSTSADTLISSAREWIGNNPSSDADIAVLNEYIEKKMKEPAWLERMEKDEQDIYKNNIPQEHCVTIDMSYAEADKVAEAVYVDCALPPDTLAIRPNHAAGGVSFGRIDFVTYDSGEMAAETTVVNNTAKDTDAVLWIAAYKDGSLADISFKKATLHPGERLKMQADVSRKDIDGCRAGVCKDLLSMKMYGASADMRAYYRNEIDAVYINGVKLDGFYEDKTEYTYYVNRLETIAPHVSVALNNTGAPVYITQAEDIGDNAVIKTDKKTYTIRFENEPFPALDGIRVGDSYIEEFSADVYSYSADVGANDNITVTAQAKRGLMVEVMQPSGSGSKAFVAVTAPFGNRRIYTIDFNRR